MDKKDILEYYKNVERLEDWKMFWHGNIGFYNGCELQRDVLYPYKNTVVLDPFVGAGTTCIVAKKLGCNYLGFDIDKKYVNISKQKLF